jgi:hypothetical protein
MDTLTQAHAAVSGRYRLEREIGAGGSAIAYIAHTSGAIARSRSKFCARRVVVVLNWFEELKQRVRSR